MQAPELNPHRDIESDQRLYLVGVDESHVDSHDAYLAARSFARDEDRVTLQCVVDKTKCSESLKESIKKAFVNYAARDHHCAIILAPHDSTTIAQSFIKESQVEDATMLCLGAGTKLSGGSLGSVVQEVLQESKRHVCVVKPGRDLQPGRAKKVVFATLPSTTCHNGLLELASILNPEIDSLEVIVISHHKGPNDERALAEAQKVLEGSPLDVVFNFVRRTPGDSVGQTLLNHVDSGDCTLLALATSRTSKTTLGSTSSFVTSHGGVCCLILKVAGQK